MTQFLGTSEITNGNDCEGILHQQEEQLPMTTATHEDLAIANTREERQFRRLYMAFFVIFLMVALVGRVLPEKWRPWSGDAVAKRSVIGEAKAAANTILPYVFMA